MYILVISMFAYDLELLVILVLVVGNSVIYGFCRFLYGGISLYINECRYIIKK